MLSNKEIKREVLRASFAAGACHIGSALSCVDILVDIFNRMKPKDRFIFSKASGAATLYAILAEKGHFHKKEIAFFLKNYPEVSKEIPGVIHSVGSVGHGLAVAVGMAYADRKRDVYCLISDGECQEGVTYECALFAHQHELENLHVICDYNSLQACGWVNDIIDVRGAIDFFSMIFPNFEAIYTIKGDGVDFMERDYTWHYKNLTPELLEKALAQI
jgi:transketolase